MLSFIVPTYNPKADIFEKHARSLKVQALDDWEAIYVLDGPSDLARSILKKVFGSDPRVTILEQPHAGAQTARNLGRIHAKGDYLCFFDSDCVIEPGASKMWVEQFEKHPEVGFIYSGYKFFGERYAIESEPWDPWTLKIRNYISACFPVRASICQAWTEGLKSLQDWDFWLSNLERATDLGFDPAKVGLFIRGYAFATAFPDPESISGKGCLPDVWLDRIDAVKKLHRLPERDIVVTSIANRHDAVALAKLINADFLNVVYDKPHRYKTIVQVGFSFGQDTEKCAANFQQKEVKKVLFWTPDNINELYNSVPFRQVDAMSKLLNEVAVQYVEDREAKKLMERAGFKVQVMPLPLGDSKLTPLPAKPKWAVDISGDYGPMMAVIERSLPDMELEMIGAGTKLTDCTGLIHFFPDRSLSTSIKRAHLNGRHVVSNVQQPYCGFVDDKWDHEKFMVEIVERVRAMSKTAPDPEAAAYYSTGPAKLLEAIKPEEVMA